MARSRGQPVRPTSALAPPCAHITHGHLRCTKDRQLPDASCTKDRPGRRRADRGGGGGPRHPRALQHLHAPAEPAQLLVGLLDRPHLPPRSRALIPGAPGRITAGARITPGRMKASLRVPACPRPAARTPPPPAAASPAPRPAAAGVGVLATVRVTIGLYTVWLTANMHRAKGVPTRKKRAFRDYPRCRACIPDP